MHRHICGRGLTTLFRRAVKAGGRGLLLLGSGFAGSLLPLAGQDGLPRPDHVVIVIEENKSFGRIIGAPSATYINELAARGALFTSYLGIRHPSQPNYLALFSGSTQGLGDDSCPHTFNAPNLASELLGGGWSFTGYSESMPRAGYHGCSAGGYQRKHNPWVNFPNVPDDVNQPWTSFPTNFNELPTLAIVVPNQNNDMHDGSVAHGDAWLQGHLSAYIEWAQTNNSLFILTWDEGYPENRIVTLFLGPMVRPGEYCERLSHYSLLRTLLSMYGLTPMAKAIEADPITSVWTAESSAFPVNVALDSPVDGTMVPGPASLELTASASASDSMIARVEFYERGARLGEATESPYQLTLTNLAVGDHCFIAQATDGLGRRRMSASVRVHVFNPFVSWRGSYQGLILNPEQPSPETSGSFALNLNTLGGFTAKLVVGGRAYRFADHFDGPGTALARAPLPQGANQSSFLEAALRVELTNGVGQLQGELSRVTLDATGQELDRVAWATVFADRVTPRSRTDPAPQAGHHTLALLGDGDGALSPGGHGFAQVTVATPGSLRASGRLADGTVLSASSSVTDQDRWPFYQPLRPGGVLIGWVWFTNGVSLAGTGMGGELTWLRPAFVGQSYPAGFTNTVPVIGSAYLAPGGVNSRILAWTNGRLVLEGAGYDAPLTEAVQLDKVGHVTGSGLNPIVVRISPVTGIWKGTVTPAAGAPPTVIQGAVLQSQQIGLGFFVGTNGSGRVRLEQE